MTDRRAAGHHLPRHRPVRPLGVVFVAVSARDKVRPRRPGSRRGYPVPVTPPRARVSGTESKTRFILDLDQHSANVLRSADLVPCCLRRLASGDVPLAFRHRGSGCGLVKAFRYGLVMAGGSRIVTDSGEPARIDTVLDASRASRRGLSSDAPPTTREAFLQGHREGRQAGQDGRHASGSAGRQW